MRPKQNQAQINAQKLSLGNKQRFFARIFMEMLIFAHLKGYDVVLEDGKRSPEEAARLAKKGGIAISRSLHIKKLAHDISLFKNRKWLKSNEDYKELGEYFESLGGPWGGHFGDGGHFSVEHEGVR